MKPFDLEKALAGAPVVTRDGREVTSIVLMDAPNDNTPLVVVVDGLIFQTFKCGKFHQVEISHRSDLFMATVKREGWVNLAPTAGVDFIAKTGQVWTTKDEAIANSRPACIATVKIEWEE